MLPWASNSRIQADKRVGRDYPVETHSFITFGSWGLAI